MNDINTYPRYMDLRIGVKGRMADLRAAADAFNSDPARVYLGRPYTWRDMRRTSFNTAPNLSGGMNGNTPVYYAQGGPQFRRERFADECGSGRVQRRDLGQ